MNQIITRMCLTWMYLFIYFFVLPKLSLTTKPQNSILRFVSIFIIKYRKDRNINTYLKKHFLTETIGISLFIDLFCLAKILLHL